MACSSWVPKLSSLVMIVRGVSALAGLAVAVAACYGFGTAKELVDQGGKTVVGNTASRDLGLFVGVLLFFLIFAGGLICLSEVRKPAFVLNFIVRWFGYLTTFIGRGLFQILAGFCLVVLSPILAKIIGAVTIGCGIMQVLFSYFVKTPYQRAGTTADAGAGGKGGAPVWPPPEAYGDGSASASTNAVDVRVDDGHVPPVREASRVTPKGGAGPGPKAPPEDDPNANPFLSQ